MPSSRVKGHLITSILRRTAIRQFFHEARRDGSGRSVRDSLGRTGAASGAQVGVQDVRHEKNGHRAAALSRSDAPGDEGLNADDHDGHPKQHPEKSPQWECASSACHRTELRVL